MRESKSPRKLLKEFSIYISTTHLLLLFMDLVDNKGSIWYMCLKIKIYYLQIFVKIHVDKKIYKNI